MIFRAAAVCVISVPPQIAYLGSDEHTACIIRGCLMIKTDLYTPKIVFEIVSAFECLRL